MERRVYERLLNFAVRNEVKAWEFYRDAAAKLEDAYLKELFAGLAADEKRHRMTLDGFRAAGLNALHFEHVPDYQVSETVEAPEVSPKMKPVDAFALAMKNEQEAMELYSAMADATSQVQEKDMLLELAAMEREHKHKMEQAFVDVAYPEVW